LSEKKLAIVLGGTKGIGKGVALQLADQFDLALVYSNDDLTADSTVAECRKINPFVKHFRCDASKLEESRSLYKEITKDFNRTPDVLVNTIGISINNLFLLDNFDEHIRSFEVNYFAPVIWCKLVVPDMIRNKFGRIINFSSNNVLKNSKGSSSYCASKAALEKFSTILGVEVAKYNITVNVIQPGIVRTTMSEGYINKLSENEYEDLVSPTGKLIEVSEIAKTVRFLIESNQINSAILTVDSGHALYRKI